MAGVGFLIARVIILAAVLGRVIAAAAQAPPAVDTSKIGPRVGAVVPAVSGVDQFGRPQSLQSISGPKGAMLVFFRSADW
jgi:hypothetical protein